MNNEIERLKAENQMLKSVNRCFYRIIKGYFADLSGFDITKEPLKTMLGVFDNFYRKTEEPTVPEAGKAEKEGTEE
ncbi:hypothetical protein EOM81_12815 [bacterium]|nr:hypothetical protein [bacterium]